jgi:hypothetical protein
MVSMQLNIITHDMQQVSALSDKHCEEEQSDIVKLVICS